MSFSQFRRYELKKFCFTIGFKPIEVEVVLQDLDASYDEWVENKIDKQTGKQKCYLDKKPKTRTIRPSLGKLKIIQTNIKNRILTPIQLPDCVHGGVKKRSNITNSKPHQGKKYKFTTDLQEFYPNISSQRVYDTFVKLGFSKHYSHWLTKLTTWKHQLPQGTPTSPHIANIVFLETDKKLMALCKLHNITYTRYVDDLSFSSDQDFQFVLNEIINLITNDNFKINYRKTFYNGKQTITGIDVFLHKIDAPEKIQKLAQTETDSNAEKRPFTQYLNNIRKTNKKKLA